MDAGQPGRRISHGHTIRGQGNLGANSIGVVNNGTITAGVTGAALFIDPSNVGNFDNNAMMQAVGGGLMQLYGGFGGAFDNAGGTIQATGAGSEVQLITGASVTGGTLHSEDGGLIRVPVSQTALLTGVTVDSGSQVRVDNNATLRLAGTLTTVGTDLAVAAGQNPTDVEVLGNVTLGGSGRLSLESTTGASNARIRGTGGGTLTNAAGHTIRGRGNIGTNSALVVINEGAISADDPAEGALLFVDPGNGFDLQNRAMMEAVGGGLMQLYGGFGGAFDNVGGTIQAVGADSEVQLISGASVTGGTMHSEDGGLIRIPGSQTVSLTNLTIDSGSQLQVDNNGTLRLIGAFDNRGSVDVISDANPTHVSIIGEVALHGAGDLLLGGAGNSRINGSGLFSNNDTYPT